MGPYLVSKVSDCLLLTILHYLLLTSKYLVVGPYLVSKVSSPNPHPTLTRSSRHTGGGGMTTRPMADISRATPLHSECLRVALRLPSSQWNQGLN